MAKRNLLHKSKLIKFGEWVHERGLRIRDPKGLFEIFRFESENGGPMPIIFKGKSEEHYSCNEYAAPYVRKFIKETRLEKGE